MGQNNTRGNWANSKDYFRHQLELYQWRADPIVNSHISRVFFQPHSQIKDRERLKNFVQGKLFQSEYISINQLVNLGEEGRAGKRQEVMSFENYICTLAELTERLTQEEVLYVLQVMFSGFEVLLSKFGKCKSQLHCCFVTLEGQVRVWLGQDYKINQVQEAKKEGQTKSCIFSSEMSLLRRILQLGQKLSSNHTEFLHFNRQFKSCMERDILQNWNFANARKLINSYVYTYRINLPNNIKAAIGRATQYSATPSKKSTFIESHTSFSDQKNLHMQETGLPFMQESIMGSYPQRKDGARPFSHSDYSHSKKSDSVIDLSIKSHSKKFSSTDLKSHDQRNKDFESPHMSRSQFLPIKSKQMIKFKRKETSNNHSSVQTQRIGRQRQYARIQKDEARLYNLNTSLGFSPASNSVQTNLNSSPFQSDLYQNMKPTTIKQTKNLKEKKKLEKKVATISRYISYYQKENQGNSRQIAKDIPEQSNLTRPNIVHFNSQKQRCNVGLNNQFSNNNSMMIPVSQRNKEMQPTTKFKYQNNEILGQDSKQSSLNKGRTQFSRSQCNSQRSGCISSNDFTNPRMCLTIKTINKLLENNDVSVHESKGSFMSLEEGQCSEYSGVLCKMGRSVNILNAPSSKPTPTLQKKPCTIINRSINK